MICLDVRNGEILYNENLPNGSTTVLAVANPERKKLEIRCNAMTAILAFSETKAEKKRAETGEAANEAEASEKGQDPRANANRAAIPPPAPTPDPFGNPFDR